MDELRLGETTGARIRITGDPALETEDFTAANDHATIAGGASFVMVSAILFLALGTLRPILATTITTIVGLIPLSLSDPMWMPLCLAIIFGLLVSTVTSLLIIPCLYIILTRDAKSPGQEERVSAS